MVSNDDDNDHDELYIEKLYESITNYCYQQNMKYMQYEVSYS